VHEFTATTIDGAAKPIADYRGKALLIVNTASKCGFTPQYASLQTLYERYRERGLEVLAFPANDFMGQEPGTDEEIGQFCELNYGVTFPLFSKISVKGGEMHPLYQEITTLPEPIGGDILWNFQKYLVNKQGQVVQKIGPQTTPEDAAVTGSIEALLAE
jgi:glutathione peroxidase